MSRVFIRYGHAMAVTVHESIRRTVISLFASIRGKEERRPWGRGRRGLDCSTGRGGPQKIVDQLLITSYHHGLLEAGDDFGPRSLAHGLPYDRILEAEQCPSESLRSVMDISEKSVLAVVDHIMNLTNV